MSSEALIGGFGLDRSLQDAKSEQARQERVRQMEEQREAEHTVVREFYGKISTLGFDLSMMVSASRQAGGLRLPMEPQRARHGFGGYEDGRQRWESDWTEIGKLSKASLMGQLSQDLEVKTYPSTMDAPGFQTVSYTNSIWLKLEEGGATSGLIRALSVRSWRSDGKYAGSGSDLHIHPQKTVRFGDDKELAQAIQLVAQAKKAFVFQ